MRRPEPQQAPLALPPGRRLNLPERARLVGEILAAYLDARRALRRAPIARAIDSLRARGAAAPGSGGLERLEEVRRLGRAVTRTLVLIPGDTRCLARSLVLTRLLAARGIDARLVIGARTSPDFLAHAWVEYLGEPVLSPGDGSFARLTEL